MKNKILLFSIIYVLLFNFNIYSMGDVNMVNKKIDLVRKFNLNKTNKIIIITEKFSLTYAPLVNKEITDKSIISEFIEVLRSLKEVPVCDTRPQYTVTFYKDTERIVSLGFFINNDWYFIRLDSKEGQKDYEPGRNFARIWKKIQAQ